MKTLAVYPPGKVRKARKDRKKLKKIAISIGASFGMIIMLTIMVLLMMKMSVGGI
ncbi:MAG: hypothetical protein ACE5KK_03740 [Candidatus Brocadiales bacterium]